MVTLTRVVARLKEKAAVPKQRLIAVLDRTSKSISAYVGRGGSLNAAKGQELAYRYDDAKSDLDDAYPGAWGEWCKSKQFHPGHTAFDLFA